MTKIHEEIWKPIPKYEAVYEASNTGKIRRISSVIWKGREMRQRTTWNKYLRIELCFMGVRKSHPVHRLIALAFIPNPESKKYINHKNGIRNDNRIENLEWCTNSENQKHSFEVLGRKPVYGMRGKTGSLCKNSKPVLQFDLDGNLIKRWDSTASIYREKKFTNISLACLQGIVRHGYKWQYA